MNKVSKNYKNNQVLNDVEFEFNSGVTLILGDNGSGKTTLLKTLGGFIKKYDGNVECADDASLLLDAPSLYSFKSGKENIFLFLNDEEQKNSEQYINLFNMNDYINKLVKSYSNGMKKKLSLVIALSKNKKYLLLDEPTNSLDIESVGILKNILLNLKKDKHILISSHDISIYDIDLIDVIFKLKNGKLITLNVQDLDYKYYKIKTLNEIADFEYEFEHLDGYYYFKVFNNKIMDFVTQLSKFLVVEMNTINFLDDIYMRGLYHD